MNPRTLFTLILSSVMMAISTLQALAEVTPVEPQTSNGVYQISTEAHLKWFRNKVNSGGTSIKGKLISSISLTDNWTPIGTSSKVYTGTFDGNGKTISGMKIDGYTSNYQGLFGYVNGATISHFELSGSMNSSKAGLTSIGGVVGYAKGQTTLSDIVCNVGININNNVAQKHMGGIVGHAEGQTKVERCTATGSINAGTTTDCIGGIMGYVAGESSASITNCVCSSLLSTYGTEPIIGGILGYNNDTNKNFGGIQHCLFNGQIAEVEKYTYVGGIVGQVKTRATTITDNYYRQVHDVPQCAMNASSGVTVPESNLLTTLDECRTGAITWALNGNAVGSDSNPWRQTIGTDDYPRLSTYSAIVYQYTRCNDAKLYSNDNTLDVNHKYHNFEIGQSTDNTYCSACNHTFIHYTTTDKAALVCDNRSFATSIVSHQYGTIELNCKWTKAVDFYDYQRLETVIVPSTVTELGQSCFYYCKSLKECVLPEKLRIIGSGSFAECTSLQSCSLPNNLIAIYAYAFLNCTNLEGILPLPSTLTSIGERAFDGCVKLTGDLHIPCKNVGNSAFNGCTKLNGSLTFCDGTTTIQESTFYNCPGIKTLVLPTTLTTIGNGAFSGCSGITSELTLPSTLTSIGIGAFTGCKNISGDVTIPAGVETLPEQVFFKCEKLKSMKFNEGLKTIGNSAFENCGFTNQLTLPSTLTTIGERAFYCCNIQGSLTIPNSVTSIGKYAFYDCTGLTGTLTLSSKLTTIESGTFRGCSFSGTLTIPASVTSIAVSAFYFCKEFSKITVNSKNTKYDSRNSSNAIIEKSTNTLIMGCKKTTIPNSVTSIGADAFFGCSGLTSISIPSSVKEIGASAFDQCTSLTSISIPSSVTKIGNGAFEDSKKLSEIKLNSIPVFGYDAFDGISTNASITLSLTDGSYVYTASNPDFPTLTTAPTYTRTMAAGSQWGTVVLPFAVATNDDVQLYELSQVTSSAMKFAPVESVAANTPCVFKKKVANATSVTFTATSADVATATPSTPAAVDGLAIRGTYTQLTNQTGIYFIAQDKFWRADDPITISPFRAWFEGTLPSQASLRIEEADDTEDLQLISDSDGTLYMVNGTSHDLQGRQTNSQKGLQIRGGRVVMIK